MLPCDFTSSHDSHSSVWGCRPVTDPNRLLEFDVKHGSKLVGGRVALLGCQGTFLRSHCRDGSAPARNLTGTRLAGIVESPHSALLVPVRPLVSIAKRVGARFDSTLNTALSTTLNPLLSGSHSEIPDAPSPDVLSCPSEAIGALFFVGMLRMPARLLPCAHSVVTSLIELSYHCTDAGATPGTVLLRSAYGTYLTVNPAGKAHLVGVVLCVLLLSLIPVTLCGRLESQTGISMAGATITGEETFYICEPFSLPVTGFDVTFCLGPFLNRSSDADSCADHLSSWAVMFEEVNGGFVSVAPSVQQWIASEQELTPATVAHCDVHARMAAPVIGGLPPACEFSVVPLRFGDVEEPVFERCCAAAGTALSLLPLPLPPSQTLHVWQNHPSHIPSAPAAAASAATSPLASQAAATGASNPFAGVKAKLSSVDFTVNPALNLRIGLWRGNLLDLKVDAVVASSDGSIFRPGKGLAAQIMRMTNNDKLVVAAAGIPPVGEATSIRSWCVAENSGEVVVHRAR